MASKGKLMERSQVGFAQCLKRRTEEDGVKKEETMRGGVVVSEEIFFFNQEPAGC